MANIARKHHYVPQCYLKAFAAPRKGQPQTTVFDAVQRKVYSAGIGNIAAERDFNRYVAEGSDPNAVESALAKFEGELGPALERIIAARSLSNVDDRAYLLNFMCLLAVRNPRLRGSMTNAQAQTARIIMDMALYSKERWEAQMARAKKSGALPDKE